MLICAPAFLESETKNTQLGPALTRRFGAGVFALFPRWIGPNFKRAATCSLHIASVAQSVEHVLGKDEVIGSIPI